ncbi:hypothetical protein DH2020_009790 [Rehmannia glutinosa]|uniref:Homeobox-leucine zipper protein n=1 Tax=Rehmannia glutinosa TaxID=99300 RepID=A0ABR0X7A2_REHGL
METPTNNSSPQTSEENNPKSTKKKSKNNIARRFSDEQIKSLESIFKLEAKLEPRKKIQLARDLGLQPRQVAIWFQNKRARWKSKQIEQEYKALRANYDFCYLSQRFALKTLLLLQLQELNDLVKNLDHKVNLTEDEFKEYPNSSNEGMDHNEVMKTDDKNFTKDFEKTEEQELVSWDEEEEISHLTSPEKWCDFSSGGLFDHSSGTSNWWEVNYDNR